MFGCEVGLSDHTMGIGAAVAAVAFGASVIEKHFTLKRADGGVDSTFSMEPDEFKALVDESEIAFQALGTVQYGITHVEEKSKMFKRSLFAVKDIEPGEIFSTDNVKVLRPGSGMAPKYYKMVLGKMSKSFISKGMPLTWELL